MKRITLRAAALILAFGLFCAFAGAGVALAVQTHMVNARSYLESALTELNAAEANKNGHRVNAITYVKDAINEVNLGIQAAQ